MIFSGVTPGLRKRYEFIQGVSWPLVDHSIAGSAKNAGHAQYSYAGTTQMCCNGNQNKLFRKAESKLHGSRLGLEAWT